MITVFVHQNGQTRIVDRVEPEWLDPASGVDAVGGSDGAWGGRTPAPERRVPLPPAVGRGRRQRPAVSQDRNLSRLSLSSCCTASTPSRSTTQFATRDVDFFLGRNYLVTVHDGESRSIDAIREMCGRHEHILQGRPGRADAPHRGRMVDNYRPVFEEIEARIGRLEEQAFAGHERLSRQVMKLKRDVSSMRRVLVPQRDAIGRLARREFPMISDEMAYRFRDVYDHVVRLTEEAILFQDRVTGIFEVNLSTVSHRLNQVMKLLTVMSTIFLPLTVLTGMWGMNIPIPHLPGGPEAQFWWIGGMMVAIIAAMLVFFRRNKWI